MADEAPKFNLGGAELFSTPSPMINLLPAFRGTSTQLATRVERFHDLVRIDSLPSPRGHRRRNGQAKRHRVKIELRKSSNSGAPSNKQKKQVLGSMEMTVIGDPSASNLLESDCLQTFATLDTDCLLTLLALVSMAIECGGMIVPDVLAIAQRRSWRPESLDGRSRPTSATRRERLHEHTRLLTEIEFVITDLCDKHGRYVALPILRYYTRAGQVRPTLVEQTTYEFHPLLWREMTEGGRYTILDRGLLNADPKKHEWAIRLGWYIASRWARSWVSKGLDKNGGRITERMGIMLAGACVDFNKQFSKQGRKWLRRTYQHALDQLKFWSPRSLLGGFEIDEHKTDPLQDRVTFWPTHPVADGHTAARSKSIRKRDARKTVLGQSGR